MRSKEKLKISNRAYYIKNRDILLEKSKAYWRRPENKENIKKLTARAQETYRKTPKYFYKVLSRNARSRNLRYLTQKEFINWYSHQIKKCTYCDIPEVQLSGEFAQGRGSIVTRLTIDRKDNSIGYLPKNMALACYRCNETKSDFFTADEMKKLSEIFIKPKWQKLQ